MYRPGPCLAAVFLVFVAACTTGAEPEDTAYVCTEAEDALSWDSWGAGFFAGYCRTCHSADTPDRRGAPEAVNYDTLEEVRTFRASIERAVLEQQTMPVGGGVPDADLVALESFLKCGL